MTRRRKGHKEFDLDDVSQWSIVPNFTTPKNIVNHPEYFSATKCLSHSSRSPLSRKASHSNSINNRDISRRNIERLAFKYGIYRAIK